MDCSETHFVFFALLCALVASWQKILCTSLCLSYFLAKNSLHCTWKEELFLYL